MDGHCDKSKSSMCGGFIFRSLIKFILMRGTFKMNQSPACSRSECCLFMRIGGLAERALLVSKVTCTAVYCIHTEDDVKDGDNHKFAARDD